ncbi:MAG TPA: hypothetical protein VG297_00415 [Bryobacteraceae bacterium]|nr:hypothetical protein [Bryobacteraceae bacterium]
MLTRREFLPFSLLAAVLKRTAFVSWDDAGPLFASCRLDGSPRGIGRANWPRWIARHDADIRARLLRGEEDSLVNFVLYGVSFTSRTRGEDIDGRIGDFLRAVAKPGSNERLIWLKRVLARQSQPAESWVRNAVARYLAEQQQYARDPDVAQLYRNRGLSVDTNFRPNWAIEQTLADLRRRGVLQSVKRAAVIGPGLDFTDKDGGFDYYPLQTLQPFALVDSLLRLGLSRDPRVSVFDISAQTLDHIGRTGRIELVLDRGRQWNPEALAYWRRFGDRIGSPVEALPAPPQVRDVERRAVSIRPEIVNLLQPRDLNVVTERANERFDLIVATNILVYYDEFERALASLNIAAMLADGGVFLANSALPECQILRLHETGRIDVKYSNEPNDDDRIEIYSGARFSRPLGPV